MCSKLKRRHRLQLGVLKNCQAEQFSKFLSVDCKFECNVHDTYFVCHEAVVLSFASNFVANLKFQ